jgi:hypothetical protein
MQRLEIPPGTEYGDLTVVNELESVSHNKRRFLCRCVCDQRVVVRLDHLRSGHTSSCGKCGLEYDGQRKTVAQWAREKGIKNSTLRARLKIMPLREALERK